MFAWVKLKNSFLALDTRWCGLLGGVVTGLADSLLYRATGEKVSIAITLEAISLFCMAGFILGLLFEHFHPEDGAIYAKFSFIGSCTLTGALVLGALGPAFAKIATDDCFKDHNNCREFVGNAEFGVGTTVLALSISALCYFIQMRRRRTAWIKGIVTASFIAAFTSVICIEILNILQVGPIFFDIDKPTVTPQTVLVGGAILGVVAGGVVGMHAALMLAYAPERYAKDATIAIATPARLKPEPEVEDGAHTHAQLTARGELSTSIIKTSTSTLKEHHKSEEESTRTIRPGLWLRYIVDFEIFKRKRIDSNIRKSNETVKHSRRDSMIVISLAVTLILVLSFKTELSEKLLKFMEIFKPVHGVSHSEPGKTNFEDLHKN